MELTPEEQAEADRLDIALPNTQTIKKIFNNQEDMIKGFEDDRAFNKSEFAKGAEKFKEISSELKEVTVKVDNMEAQIENGFKRQREDLAKHLSETKDNQITDLKNAVEKRDSEDKSKRNRVNAIKDGILISLIGGILLAATLYFLIPKE